MTNNLVSSRQSAAGSQVGIVQLPTGDCLLQTYPQGVNVYLKRWTVALLAMLALVACGSPAVDTVARVDNVVLSRKELDVRIDRLLQGFQKQPQQGAAPSRIDIEKRIVSLFIDQNLVLGMAKARGVAVSDKEIDEAVGKFRDSVAQSGAQSGGTAP